MFRSPAVHTPQEGRDLVAAYLAGAMVVLGPELQYHDEWTRERDAVLRFTTVVGGRMALTYVSWGLLAAVAVLFAARTDAPALKTLVTPLHLCLVGWLLVNIVLSESRGVSMQRFVLLVSMTSLAVLLPLLPPVAVAPTWLVVLTILGMVGWALFGALLNILGALAPREVPLVISLNLTAGSLGGAIAAYLGGLVIEPFGAASLGLLGAAFTLAALGLALANRKILRSAR